MADLESSLVRDDGSQSGDLLFVDATRIGNGLYGLHKQRVTVGAQTDDTPVLVDDSTLQVRVTAASDNEYMYIAYICAQGANVHVTRKRHAELGVPLVNQCEP